MRHLILILLIIPTFFFVNSVEPVSGVSFSAKEYWFYVQKPTMIDYPEMEFTFSNSNDWDVKLSCKQEYVEGLDITVYLDWYNITLQPSERATNRYSMFVNETFGNDYIVRIICDETVITEDNATKTSTSGNVITHVTYYSDEQGSLLDLQIVDQSGSPRNSSVEVLYRETNDNSWSPILNFNDTRWIGVMPNGLYQVIAKDQKSSIIGQEVFILENDSTIEIELFLLGYARFIYQETQVGERSSIIGMNTTINNFLGTIEKANLYMRLFKDGKIYSETPKTLIEELPVTTDYEVVLWFPQVDWEEGEYTIVGYIDQDNNTLSTKELYLGEYEVQVEKVLSKNSLYSLGVFLIVVPPISFYINRKYHPSIRFKCTDCGNKYLKWNNFCNNCGTRKVLNE